MGLKLDTKIDIEPWLKDVNPEIIEEIHFGGNTIGVDAALALAEFLQKTKILKVILVLFYWLIITQLTHSRNKVADFSDIFTGRLISEIPLALSAICDALKDKTSLIELNLSDNAFGGRSVDPMVPFLTHNRSFQVLKLNNNGLGPAGGVVLANALLESARLSKEEGKRSNLRTVICGRNRLENGSASSWADAFAAHGTLVEVRMPQNGIRMEGVTALAHGLMQCTALQYIDFQDNTFTAEGELTGIEAWTDALPSWPELQTLNLSDCVLSAEGEVPILVTALAAGSNPKLRSLQLQNNNLETDTFATLAKAISTTLKGLMALELQWNEAEEDDEHLETLALSLKQRGGKLFATDDDEEEEEEAEETQPSKEVQRTPRDATDDLADLLSKVGIA